MSPVVEFVWLAWRSAGGQPHSWALFNHQLYEVCHVAARGFKWELGDMDALERLGNHTSRLSKCLLDDGYERLYATAVEFSNISACLELERYIGRAPIIADGANKRARDRLCLGSVFRYGDARLRVTSFRGDGKAVCVLVLGPKKVHRLGPAEIRADRARRKERADRALCA